MPRTRFRQHPAVRAELRAAILWYEERANLGDQLLADFDRAIDRIKSRPSAWPPMPASSTGEIRRVLLHQFPYYVPYLVHENDIVVLAFAHHKRRPLYWLARI